jgi:hypothetical protein
MLALIRENIGSLSDELPPKRTILDFQREEVETLRRENGSLRAKNA